MDDYYIDKEYLTEHIKACWINGRPKYSPELHEVLSWVDEVPSADVQPVTFCKDCQWLADIKDVDTGEMYHACGVFGLDVPDGFACNQGKRKGADDE